MSYKREIPRDLFNEAKLLKCLGLLSLKIHDGKLPPFVEIEHYQDPQREEYGEPDSGFDIRQDPSDGSIYSSSIRILIKGKQIPHHARLNDRSNFSLMLHIDEVDYDVFDEEGEVVCPYLLD